MRKELKTSFLILGGGLSGLFAALFLKRNGRESIILEKADDIGGLARTYSIKGHSFDIGGHRISFDDPQNIKLIQFLIPELSVLTRKSKIYYRDKFIDYPISLSSFAQFNKKQLIKILSEIVFINRFVKPRNFEEWIKRYYGSTIYKIVFEHYSRKVWGQDCRDLSAEWAKKRIGYYSVSNLFLNRKAKENKRQFYYPDRGIGVLAQNIHADIVPETTVLTNATVQNIQLENSFVKGVICDVQGETHEIKCEHLISTIPLRELLSIAPFSNDEKFRLAREKIKYRSLIQANLVLNREYISDWHWCYFPDENLMFSRCYIPKCWHRNMSEDEKSTLLCVEILCQYGDEVWNMDEDLLLKRLNSQLMNVGLIHDEHECLSSSVLRERYAYPLPYLYYEGYLQKLIREMSSVGNIHLAGRSGTHSYFDIEECMENSKTITDGLLKTM